MQISLVNDNAKKDVKETEISKLENQNEIKEVNTCDNVIVIDDDNNGSSLWVFNLDLCISLENIKLYKYLK